MELKIKRKVNLAPKLRHRRTAGYSLNVGFHFFLPFSHDIFITEIKLLMLLREIYLFIYLWVPVTTTWRVFRLPMEERPTIWRVAANISNKQ